MRMKNRVEDGRFGIGFGFGLGGLGGLGWIDGQEEGEWFQKESSFLSLFG